MVLFNSVDISLLLFTLLVSVCLLLVCVVCVGLIGFLWLLSYLCLVFWLFCEFGGWFDSLFCCLIFGVVIV